MMATVSTYLVVIASGVVRERVLAIRSTARRPERNTPRLAGGDDLLRPRLSPVALNIYPVKYLQALVVFSTSTIAATLLVPAVMAAYWRRATVPGAIAAMFVGSATMLALFGTGWVDFARFAAMIRGSGRTRRSERITWLRLGAHRVGAGGIDRGGCGRKPGDPAAGRAARIVAVRSSRRPAGSSSSGRVVGGWASCPPSSRGRVARGPARLGKRATKGTKMHEK